MKSIRRELTLRLLAGFGLLLAVGNIALYLGTRGMLLREFDDVLLTKARSLASLTENDHGTVKLEFRDELMPEFGGGQRDAFFELWLLDGHMIERSDSLGGVNLPRRSGKDGKLVFWNLPLPGGKPGRAVSFTFDPSEEDHESSAVRPPTLVTVAVALDRTRLDGYLRIFAIGAAATSALMMAGAALVATLAVRRSLASLTRLGDEVAAIDETSLDSRLACAHLPSELTPIGTRLNDFLARLDAAFVRERRFSDDVAHELRTPVAELRALAEVSLGADHADAPAAGAFHDALAIAMQMEEIVNGLLAIARCESGGQAIRREPLPLLPLMHDLWKPHVARARKRTLQVEFRVPPGTVVWSDRSLLRTIVANLFSNAADHSPVAGKVCITATRNEGSARLAVSNPADALTEDDLPHLFERFWRKDTARTSGIHAGLGLSIAQAAARLLGAEIHAEITDDRAFVIHLLLPLAEPERESAATSRFEFTL